ncbi:MAG TPA: nitrile hydratase subunit beta [Myxococcota bacterium]|nr:nitrile hydratase subunit beta [Myxococcota bacterium]
MNGIHDMGGMHGFGRVEIEKGEPVFHGHWEARVFGMSLLAGLRLGGNIDERRHGLERLDPVTYLRHGYYGRWLARLEQDLLERGVLRPGELAARLAGQKGPPAPLPALPAPSRPAEHPFLRTVDRAPAFRVGDRVQTRNHQPAGHTRLTGYARTRRGVVARVYPACVFPDTNAHGEGEQPQPVYAVRFEGRELFGGSAEPRSCVFLDCFESYLEPDLRA